MKTGVVGIFALALFLSAPMNIRAEKYTKEADYILYVDEAEEIGNVPEIGGDTYGEIEPGVYTASKLYDNFYLLDGFDSNTWIYNYQSVDVKEIQSVINTQIELKTDKEIYTQPFDEDEFKTDKKFQPGTYYVAKKAFNWLLISDGTITGWISNKQGEAVFKNTLGVLQYDLEKVNYKTQIIQFSEYKRVGFVMKPDSITIHSTANYNSGSNAQQHADLLNNPTARAYTSWHFTVDDEQIIQSIPVNEVAYHAGDGQGYGNGNSIAIEMCENSDGDFEQTVDNTAKLTARLLVDLNLTMSDVKQHKDHSGKNCPKPLLEGNKWQEFLNLVQMYYDNYIGNNGTNHGWVNLDKGNWAHYESDGSLSNRWIASGKDWYLVRNGIMVRNEWIPYINGIWYFIGDDGKMVTNTSIYDGGIFYHFDSNGVWIR